MQRAPSRSTSRTSCEPLVSDDLVVYDGPELTYVGSISGSWWRWEAEAGGWARRRPSSPVEAANRPKLDDWHAKLALKLSGGPT